jgi:AraC-like DNA-binding protein
MSRIKAQKVDYTYKLDSLRQQVANAPDTLKANIYSEIADIYFRELRQYDSVLVYARKVYDLTEKQSFPSTCLWPEAWAYGEMGMAYLNMGKLDSAIYYEYLGIDYCKDKKLLEREVDAASRLIHCYFTIGDLTKAHKVLVEYDQKVAQLSDTLYIANFHNTIGVFFMQAEHYDLALDWLKRSYELFKAMNHCWVATSQINIGGTYQEMGQYDSAYHYYRLFGETAPMEQPVYNAYYQIIMGALYSDMYTEQMDSSVLYNTKGLEQALSLNMPDLASLAAFNLAETYFKFNSNQEALRYFNLSLQEAEKVGDVNRISRALTYLDDVYLALGYPDRAYEVLSRYQSLEDSLNLEKQKMEIRNLELKKKVTEMEHQKMLLDKDILILNQRLVLELLTIGALVLIAVLLLIYYFIIYRKKKHLFNRVHELMEAEGEFPDQVPELMEIPEEALAGELEGPENIPHYEKPKVRKETAALIRHLIQAWIREKGYLERVTIQDVASRMNTNSKYLSEVILYEYHANNFNEFINKLRIDHSLRLLESEPYYQHFKVESLSAHLGFGSKTTFIKAFKEITGLTPNFYIEQLRKKQHASAAISA